MIPRCWLLVSLVASSSFRALREEHARREEEERRRREEEARFMAEQQRLQEEKEAQEENLHLQRQVSSASWVIETIYHKVSRWRGTGRQKDISLSLLRFRSVTSRELSSAVLHTEPIWHQACVLVRFDHAGQA